MKIFLSWSGETSKEVANAFGDWLCYIIHTVEPFYSPDIEKGKSWHEEISDNLESCDIGLIFLTRDNLDKPWILFEAGALSKKKKTARAMTFLFGVDAIDVRLPLSQFQHTLFNSEEVRKLVIDINNLLGEKAVKQDVLLLLFDKLWPDLEDKISAILHRAPKDADTTRTVQDMVEESLSLLRGMQGRSFRNRDPQLFKKFHRTLKNLADGALRELQVIEAREEIDEDVRTVISRAVSGISTIYDKLEFELMGQMSLFDLIDDLDKETSALKPPELKAAELKAPVRFG